MTGVTYHLKNVLPALPPPGSSSSSLGQRSRLKWSVNVPNTYFSALWFYSLHFKNLTRGKWKNFIIISIKDWNYYKFFQNTQFGFSLLGWELNNHQIKCFLKVIVRETIKIIKFSLLPYHLKTGISICDNVMKDTFLHLKQPHTELKWPLFERFHLHFFPLALHSLFSGSPESQTIG